MLGAGAALPTPAAPSETPCPEFGPPAGTPAEAEDVARLGLGDQAGEDPDQGQGGDHQPAAKPPEEREPRVAG